MENDLTINQQKAIRLLLAGSTVTAAARELGIDRTSIYVWRKSNPQFSFVLKRAQSIQSQALEGDLQDLATTAIDSIRDILTSPDTTPSVRLRAAQTILNLVNRPVVQQQAEPAHENEPEPPVAVQRPAPIAMPVQRSSTHFDTFQPAAISNKIGRNEACPCGSSLKFKRCCGNPVTAQRSQQAAA